MAKSVPVPPIAPVETEADIKKDQFVTAELKPYGLLPDVEIAKLCTSDRPMVSPFVPQKTRDFAGQKAVSYGLSSYGYDIRLAPEFRVPLAGSIMDPHNADSVAWRDGFPTIINGKKCVILHPGEMILGRSIEKFDMPNNVLAQCVGKSTWARNGLFVNVTPLEPGWRGYLAIEISNVCHLRVRLYFEEGIAQLLFFRGADTAAAYEGKYQDQEGIVTGRA